MASLIGKLREWVGIAEKKVLGSLYSEAWMYGAAEVYGQINTATAVDAFSSNTAVYSIVMKDADKFGSIPRYVYTASEREEKADISGAEAKLTALINRPNRTQSQDSFYTLARAYYKVTGNAYIWLNRGDLSNYIDEAGVWNDKAIDSLPVLEMFVLASQSVQAVPKKEDVFGIQYYELDLAGTKVPIRTGDMIHWKSTNLLFDASTRIHLRGLSPLAAGYKSLELNNSMTNGAVRQAQNDGARAVIYNKTLGAMTPEQQSQLKSVIDKKINNNDVAGAVATLQGDWGMLDLGRSVKDLMLLEGKELSWKELSYLFKVPYEFFDSETTFANKEQAQVGWLTNDIMPACKQLDGEFNRVLPKAFGFTGTIQSDFSELPEMIKAMADTAKTMLEVWCITPNEVRTYLGHDEIDDDQMDEVWVPTGRTPLSKSNPDDGGEEILNQIANARGGNTPAGNAQVSQGAGRTALRSTSRTTQRGAGRIPKKANR